MTQPLEYEEIDVGGSPTLGRTSTERVAFWGATPVARPVTVSTNLVSTVIGASTSSAGVTITTWGFATQAEIDNFVTAVSTMQYACKQLGIIAGGVQTALNTSTLQFDIVDYGSPDGALFGRTSSEPISFYGATPVARLPASSANISTATTVSASTNGVATTTWGWRTSSEFAMFNTAVSSMQASMKLLGLIA